MRNPEQAQKLTISGMLKWMQHALPTREASFAAGLTFLLITLWGLKMQYTLWKGKDMTIYAAAPVPAVFICPICGDCLSSQDYLDTHMLDCHAQRPQGKLECSFCPYTSNHPSKMTRHERTHTGARPFSCPSCNKKFSCKHSLVRHQSVHTGEKPYKCSTCGQQFSCLSHLSRHEKRHLDGGKPYACRYCGQAFMQGGTARRHERQVHSADPIG